VVSLKEIENAQPQSLDDLVRNLPNVESTGGPRRISEKPMIRGLSGRRVLITIDDTRQNFQSGHKGSVFLEPELLKQVDVVRGPASSLYGSDAIGGVLAVTTKDPVDFLRKGQKNGFRIKLGYQDANQERLLSSSVYGFATEKLDYLLYGTQRKAGDLRQGGGNTLANSGDELKSVLLKLMWTPAWDHTFRLSIEKFEQTQETPVNTQISDPSGLSISDRTTERQTVRLSHHYEDPSNDFLNLRTVYYQTETSLFEKRKIDQRKDDISLVTNGLNVQNQSSWKLAEAVNSVTYGFEWYQDTQTSSRNGKNLKTYPNATVQVTGIFLQNELTLQDKWELIPGLRYDRFVTEAKELGSSRAQDQFSPKFTVSYRFQPWLRSYISYSKGFRVPNIQELYISGIHYGGDPEGIFVPNPNLKPETSTNQELGVQIENDSLGAPFTNLRFAAIYFRNQLDDFIDSAIYSVKFGETVSNVSCTNQGSCLYFENLNVQQGLITGFEAELNLQNQHLELDVAYSQTRGLNETNGEPLASIPADKWVLQLHGVISERDLTWSWRTQIVSEQTRVPGDSGLEKTPGYEVYDVSGSWRLPVTALDGLRLNLGVDNVADRRYRKHLSQLDEAGRNLKMTLTYQY
jgi:hemoglobin/transferrin/lactoferrin receptor protein